MAAKLVKFIAIGKSKFCNAAGLRLEVCLIQKNYVGLLYIFIINFV